MKCNSLSQCVGSVCDVDCELCVIRESTTTELADSKAGVLGHQPTDDCPLESIVRQTKLIDKALGSYATTNFVEINNHIPQSTAHIDSMFSKIGIRRSSVAQR